MDSGIYQIKNIITDKIYIGSSSNFIQRKSLHFSLLNRNKHHSKYLQRSYNKYGADVFKFEILFTCPKSELIRIEQYFLNNYEPEYNSVKIAGSTVGHKHSEETKEKIRQYGLKRTQTNQCKQKLRERKSVNIKVYKVCPFTLTVLDEFISINKAVRITGVNNINSVVKGKLNYAGGFIWSTTSDMSKLPIKPNKYKELKPIMVFDKQSNLCFEFNSIKSAADYFKVKFGSVEKCCEGKSNTLKSFIFIFKEDYNNNYLTLRINKV